MLPEDNVDDGSSKEITAIFGMSSPDARGNVTAYAGYRSNGAILQSQRDFAACSLGAPVGANFTRGGSDTTNPAQINDFATLPGGLKSPWISDRQLRQGLLIAAGFGPPLFLSVTAGLAFAPGPSRRNKRASGAPVP